MKTPVIDFTATGMYCRVHKTQPHNSQDEILPKANLAFEVAGEAFLPARTSFYVSETAGEIRVSIADMTGKCIREFSPNTNSHSAALITWDGAGATGHPVEEGVYFVKVHAGVEHRAGLIKLVQK
jgi:hypothetical protein